MSLFSACGAEADVTPPVEDVVVDVTSRADAGAVTADGGDPPKPDVATGDLGAPDASTEPCVTDRDFFAADLWPNVLQNRCFGCHNGSGAAKGSKLVFRGATRAGFLDYNRAALAEVAAYEVAGKSVLLQKPIGSLGHGGGIVIKAGDTSFKLLEAFIARLANPVADDACDEPSSVKEEDAFSGVGTLDAAQTFRKAALELAGRAPKDSETAFLQASGESGLGAMVDDLLNSELFLTRVAEHWNDRLLTDRYNRGADALYRLPAGEFPDRAWYTFKEDEVAKKGIPKTMMTNSAGFSNTAVARAPLELIKHVVRLNKSFSEILTADYMLVTPYSAWSYGVFDKVTFTNYLDPTEWRVTKLPKRPHAGLLTSPMFLNRFPTTATNRNRHRSRMVWKLFLATDIMALAERPIDPTEIVEHNPTMFNPDCSVCHTVMDPLAGLFQNWGDQGQFSKPKSGWFSDMLPPGYEAEKLSPGNQTEPLRWLADRIAKDPRFVTAIVGQVFEMVVGEAPVRLPSEEDDSISLVDKAARLKVYSAQQKDLLGFGKLFKDSGLNYRKLVSAVVLSRWFRASSAPVKLPEDAAAAALRSAELKLIPGARLLTPEALNRKLEATLGAVWLRYDKIPYLTHRDEYQIFYGGIDSDGVTRRIRSPNGLMAAVQARMANEFACIAVPFDFTKKAVDRKLFPYIEVNFQPYDSYGNEVPAAKTAIRETIRRLGWQLLGHRWKDGEPAFEELYALWFELQQKGYAEIQAGNTTAGLNWWHCRGVTNPLTGSSVPPSNQVLTDPNYTMRSWLAVVALMLSDAEFLYSP